MAAVIGISGGFWKAARNGACELVGIPSALVPLGIVRLFSNSAAVSLLLDLYKEAGCDSFAWMGGFDYDVVHGDGFLYDGG